MPWLIPEVEDRELRSGIISPELRKKKIKLSHPQSLFSVPPSLGTLIINFRVAVSCETGLKRTA